MACDAARKASADMGCPSTAVGKFGAGGMLMERPDEARRIVAEAIERSATAVFSSSPMDRARPAAWLAYS